MEKERKKKFRSMMPTSNMKFKSNNRNKGRNLGKRITEEILKKMNKLRSFIKESLREASNQVQRKINSRTNNQVLHKRIALKRGEEVIQMIEEWLNLIWMMTMVIN